MHVLIRRWQADCLKVRGLKETLAPVLELGALPRDFVMSAPAYERLKLLVRSLELQAPQVTAALCEQLQLPAPLRAPASAAAGAKGAGGATGTGAGTGAGTGTTSSGASAGATASATALRAAMTELAVAACACDVSRYDALAAAGLLPSDGTALAALLDRSSLRVSAESEVHDLIVSYLASKPNTPPATQETLWSTCRFTYLDAARLVSLAERPNVPPRWLALACAQRAATEGGGGGSAAAPTSLSAALGAAAGPTGSGVEAGRLKPRHYYYATKR